ncbi:MAG: succinylglutamate desuccinylase/aspartoacylase family protein [Thermomicrobiales bacterium]|nr:succinylglutamate desuccinylase/aspartoacylase family protein [Thermomicrobiales bacterium]
MSNVDTTTQFPILGELQPGTTQRHEVALPGEALQNERWPVISVTGTQPGPVLFVSAGVHGGEYPGIETAVRLAKTLDASKLTGTVIIMPVVNLPAFWNRTPFVCPVDGLNPNRMFPGEPDGTYTEQLVHAVTEEFIAHADLYIDLHGGDMVEALVPFSICRKSPDATDMKAREIAEVFGLPYLLVIDKPVQPAKGSMSFVAAAERGVPGIIAEAGGVGLLEEEPVRLLTDGIYRVMNHEGMLESAVAPAGDVTVLTSFEWLYSAQPGFFHTSVGVDDQVEEGQQVGTIDSLYGDTLETIISPVDGRVLFLTTSPAVGAQGLLMGIGIREDA